MLQELELHDAFVNRPMPLELPSLHIIGTGDKLVPNDSSQAVASCFADAQTVTHEGGHAVPSAAHVRNTFKTFVAASMIKSPTPSAASAAGAVAAERSELSAAAMDKLNIGGALPMPNKHG